MKHAFLNVSKKKKNSNNVNKYICQTQKYYNTYHATDSMNK